MRDSVDPPAIAHARESAAPDQLRRVREARRRMAKGHRGWQHPYDGSTRVPDHGGHLGGEPLLDEQRERVHGDPDVRSGAAGAVRTRHRRAGRRPRPPPLDRLTHAAGPGDPAVDEVPTLEGRREGRPPAIAALACTAVATGPSESSTGRPVSRSVATRCVRIVASARSTYPACAGRGPRGASESTAPVPSRGRRARRGRRAEGEDIVSVRGHSTARRGRRARRVTCRGPATQAALTAPADVPIRMSGVIPADPGLGASRPARRPGCLRRTGRMRSSWRHIGQRVLRVAQGVQIDLAGSDDPADVGRGVPVVGLHAGDHPAAVRPRTP